MHKFHRQYPIDRIIVDFFCSRAALIVEVDGDVHQQQVKADQERELLLTALGFRVLRFTNAQVLDQTDQALQEILDALCCSKPKITDINASKGTPSPKSSFGDFGEGAGG